MKASAAAVFFLGFSLRLCRTEVCDHWANRAFHIVSFVSIFVSFHYAHNQAERESVGVVFSQRWEVRPKSNFWMRSSPSVPRCLAQISERKERSVSKGFENPDGHLCKLKVFSRTCESAISWIIRLIFELLRLDSIYFFGKLSHFFVSVLK